MSELYRDGLFRDYFKDKIRLLSLCNALLGTDGTDPEEIEINTLDGVFFEKLQNDISCIYRDRFIVLIEQQSTVNENMPLRCLFYVAEILKKYIEAEKNKIYQKKLITLPRPEVFVLYNGRKRELEYRELKLSDAFGTMASVEVIVKLYNINAGMNEDLIKRSEFLMNYCMFVNRVQENLAAGMKFENAIADAFDYCKKSSSMTEYLEKRKWELISMLGFEYNAEDEKQALIELGIERGIEQGIEQKTIKLAKKMLASKTPIDEIATFLECSKEKILQIAKEISK